MVDLVKIRKKAKKAAEEQTGDAQVTEPPKPAAAGEQVTGSASGRAAEKQARESRDRRAAEEKTAERELPADLPAPAPAPASGSPATPAASATRRPADAAIAAGEGTTTKLDKFKAEAGRRRELEAATRDTIEEALPESVLELLTFVIAREHYAVDIERIVEIVTPRPLTRIPNADNSIVGIVSLRGTIVTLVDVRRKLRHPPAGEDTPDTRIVVVDFHGEMVGFVVDRVLRVVKLGREDIEPHPVVHASELDDSVRGVFRVAGALTILIDLDKLLDSRALAATAF